MDFIFILLINLFCSVFLLTKANICSSTKCSPFSPEARFPFRVEGLQPKKCGLPKFNLFCKNNKTLTIHFPSYGDLVVKSISYDPKRLNLIDPKNCVHRVFLSLNLSLTPFSYYHVLKQYKYINCSDKLDTYSLLQVPCLSGSAYHVYVVGSSFSVPVSCNCVKTVDIPFSYSPYLSGNSFGLGLTWNDEEGTSERRLKKYFKVSSIMAIILMAGIMLYATIYHYCKKLNVKGTSMCEVEIIDKLLGQYEPLNCARELKAGP